MDVADVFALPSNFDPEPPQASARRLVVELRTGASGLAAALLGRAALETPSAALTLYLLGGGVRKRVDANIRALHRVVLLCLALEDHRQAVLDPESQTLEDDLETLPAIARGERAELRGPIGAYVAQMREAMAALPGWARGGTSFSDALTGMLDGVTQDYRMRSFAREASLQGTWNGSIHGSALELLIEGTCIALSDESRDGQDAGANLVSRLSTGLVGLATELSRQGRGPGAVSSNEWVSQRFAIPAHIIRLDEAELRRALRATLALEFFDLLEATQYLPGGQPRAEVVRRAVASAVERRHAAPALLSAVESHSSPTGANRADVMGQMRRVATSKGEITAESRELLRGMDARLFGFQNLLDRIERDGKLDFEEFRTLRGQRQQILDDLFRIALEDAKITEDERKLLLTAMDLLPRLRGAL